MKSMKYNYQYIRPSVANLPKVMNVPCTAACAVACVAAAGYGVSKAMSSSSSNYSYWSIPSVRVSGQAYS